jgi:DNA-binding transcriptional MocR family regulator
LSVNADEFSRLDFVAISFARGVPAPDCLPVEELADCAKVAIERDGRGALSYGGGGGYEPLREWVAERHGVDPRRVLLTNGSLQGFVFLATHFFGANPGRVLVEAPTYDRPLKILAGLGAEVIGVPQDRDGLDIDALEQALETGPPPAFLYAIPTFQNPSGRTLSANRRRRLVELARERDLLILEDDPYGLVRFDGEALPTLFELADPQAVVYSSSFSKTIAPGVRVGYLVLPQQLAAAVTDLAVSTYISPNVLAEATVCEFVRRGLFEPNLERVRGLLRARRDAMLDALEREFSDEASWNRPEGGYFVWLELPAGTSAADLRARAEEAGVTFVKGSDFYPGGRGGESAARLAFSFVSPDEIGEGISRLARLVERRSSAEALSRS